MTVMTKEQIEALLDGTTPGPWRADGDPWNRIVWSAAENRVCFMAHSNGLDDARDVATSNLAAAAPDLARTALALHQQLADAKAAQAMVVERAADMIEDNVRHAKELGREIWAMPDLRALAPASGVEALAALRAERDGFEMQVTGLSADNNRLRALIAAAIAEHDDLRARLAAAEAQVGALTKERDEAVELAEERLRGQHRLSNQLNDTARELNARLAALQEALEFYANKEAWSQPPVRVREGLLSIGYENQASKVQRDRGKIARAALNMEAANG